MFIIKSGGGANKVLIDNKPPTQKLNLKEVHVRNCEMTNPFPIDAGKISKSNYASENGIDYFVYNKKIYFGNLEKGYTQIDIDVDTIDLKSFRILVKNGEVYIIYRDRSFTKINTKNNTITSLKIFNTASYRPYPRDLFAILDKIYLTSSEEANTGRSTSFKYDTTKDVWTELGSPSVFPSDVLFTFEKDGTYYIKGTDFFETTDGNKFIKLNEGNMEIDSGFVYKNKGYFINKINSVQKKNSIFELDFTTLKETKIKDLEEGNFSTLYNPNWIKIEKDSLYLNTYNTKKSNYYIVGIEKYYRRI